MGKSRLISEFHQAIQLDTGPAPQWLEGHSQSYETSVPFAPFIHLFHRYFNLQPDANAQDQYNQLVVGLRPCFAARTEEVAPFFASLLDIPLQGEAADRTKYLPPPQLRGQIFTQIAELLNQLAKSGPVVLYLDDLHWSDPTSIDLLQSLLPLTDQSPLMILTAFRPRREEVSWGFHEQAQREYSHRYQAVSLNPLDAAHARELVSNLLKIDELPENVRAKILERSEGNPFFVEEIIRSLIDNKLVVMVADHWQVTREIKHIDLPDTLAGVITARLDRLDDTTKHLLQAASVLGREFAVDILSEIVETPAQLDAGLVELQRRELVREKSRTPRRTYTFKHVLTQEAAYNSILLGNRRVFHRLAAEALIRHIPEAAAEIARHLLDARQMNQAMPYLVEAGERAARAYSTGEASEYFRQVLAKKDIISDLALLRRAYEGLGGTLAFANRIDEALEIYKEMLELAESHADIAMQISALNKTASVTALHMGEFQQADRLLIQADNLTRQYNEKSGVAETNLLRCQMCTAQADFENVVKHMDEVIQVGQEMGSKEYIALGLEHVATSLVYMMEFEESRRRAAEGLEMARIVEDRAHEAWLLSLAIPINHMHAGNPEAAVTALKQGLEIATLIGDLGTQAVSAYLLAEIARGRGEYERALEYGQRALSAGMPLEQYQPFFLVPALGVMGSIYLDLGPQFSDKIAEFHLHALHLLESPNAGITGAVAWADLGHCALTLGDLTIAEQVLDKGINFPSIFSFLERPRHLSGVAWLACARGDFDKAKRLADEAQRYVEDHSLRYHGPLTSLIQGKVYLASGDLESGLVVLEQAREEAQELGMRPLIWQAHAAAVDGLVAAGRLEEAEVERQAAEGMVIEIANHIADLELRDTYLRNALRSIH